MKEIIMIIRRDKLPETKKVLENWVSFADHPER
jgi:nitrogen regulatory protein PII